MSSIDERVVEMSFDNKQFEKGVETTIASINELKQSLKFDQVGKGLDVLSDSFRNIDTNSFSNALDAINDKFSIFGTFKDQVLRDLVGYVEGKVIGVFTQLKDAMTIDSQVWSGFSEYETKMNAIQVLKSSVIGSGDIGIEITPEVDQAAYDIIYNGLYGIGAERKAAVEAMGLDYAAVQSRVDEIVANNWEWVKSANGVAYTMDDINDTLDTMNEYADKTIYNFPQMTENLGKFTVAGIDLKQAEKSIIGLANLAASAGADATQMSQATYQMSQAMSSGIIRLMDWNSLAQRSMDTAQLKQVILEVAKQQGVASDILNKASTNFRDSLSENWLTTDIFNEALAVYADAETAAKYGFSGVYDMAMEAAQRIRTFTMLKDTITEQIQSGWTESWQYIIGDSEEAAESLTRLNDVIANLLQPTMDARNSMLEFWHDFGGREAVVNGLFNILEAFTKILGTVKTAWREIFPNEGKGGQLVAISKSFESFTQKLIMGRDTADKVRRTFKGLFAVFAMAGNVVKSLFRALSPVFDLFKKNEGQKGLLDYTASLGDFLVALHEGAVESDFFYNIFSTVVDFLISIPSKIKTAISALEQYLGVDFSAIFETAKTYIVNFVLGCAEAVKGFSSINLSPAGNFASGLKEKLGPLGKIGAFLSGFWEIIKALASKFAPVFKAIGSALSSGLSSLKNFILEGIDGVDAQQIVDLILGGSLTALIWKIIGVIGDFKDSLSGKNGFGDILKNVNDILGGFQETLSAFTLSVKADALLKIGVAIAVLAGSMWVLSQINKSGLEMAITAIATAFVELLVSLRSLSVTNPTVIASATAMLIMVGAIVELAGAMALLSLLKPESLGKGMMAISTLIIVLTKSIGKLGGLYQPALSVSAAIITFTNAIIKLIAAFALISLYNMETIAKGIVAIAGVAFVLVTSMQGLGKVNKNVAATAPAIITMSNAMIKLAGAVWLFGSMDEEKLRNGAIAVVGLLTTMSASLYALGSIKTDAKSLLAMAVTITALSNAMVIMSGAMILMRGIDVDNIAGPIAAIAGLIVVLAISAKIVEGTYPALLAMSVALLSLGMAMVQIASALALVSSFDPYSVEIAGTAIAKVLAVMGVMMAILAKTGSSGAQGVLLVAAALFVFAKAVDMLAKYNVEETVVPIINAFSILIVALTALMGVIGTVGEGIGKSWKAFAAMALTLVALGAAVAIMATAFDKVGWDQLYKVGVSMAFLLGILTIGGIVGEIAGTGMIAFAEAAIIFSAAIWLVCDAMLRLVNAFVLLATADFSGLAGNILTVCQAIIQTAPAIGAAVYAVISSIVGYATQIGVLLIQSIIALLDNTDELVTSLANLLMNIIVSTLEVLEKSAWAIGFLVLGIIAEVLEGMADNMDTLSESIVVFIIAFFDGFATAINEHADEIGDAVVNVVMAIINVIIQVFLGFGRWAMKFFGVTGEDFKNFFGSIGDFFKNFGTKISNIVNKVKGFFTGLWETLTDVGSNIAVFLSGVWDGIKTFFTELPDKLGDALSTIGAFFGGIWDSIVLFVTNIPSKLGELLSAAWQFIVNLASFIGTGIWSFLSNIGTSIWNFFINLPSNLLNIITSLVEKIKEVGTTLGTKIYTGFTSKASNFWNWFTDLPSNIMDKLSLLWEDIKEIGGYLLDGLIEGLMNIGTKIKDFCTMIWNAICEFFGIASPSKLMEEAGGYMVDGLANGLTNDGTAIDATETLCGDIGDTFSSGMDDVFNADNYAFDISSLMGENGEFIAPVLDMDTMNSQMSDFTSGQEMVINTSMNDQLSTQVASSMSEYTDYSEKVVQEISKLRTDVNSINERLDGIQVILDTGALVGELTTPINAQLGRMLSLSRRGLFK